MEEKVFTFRIKQSELCLFLFSIVFSLVATTDTFAYRPFESTDADVAARGEWEVELGAFRFSHDEENELITPSVRINYGFARHWEIVMESDLQIYKKGGARNVEIRDPAVFLKGILREGVLQKKEGLSLAGEFGILLPETVREERNAGLEGIGIASWKVWDIVLHASGGLELDREDFEPNGIWGIIAEYPFEGRFRLVSEVNGSLNYQDSPESSALIGFIWVLGKVAVDFGARKGFSEASPDWELTSGITFSF